MPDEVQCKQDGRCGMQRTDLGSLRWAHADRRQVAATPVASPACWADRRLQLYHCRRVDPRIYNSQALG